MLPKKKKKPLSYLEVRQEYLGKEEDNNNNNNNTNNNNSSGDESKRDIRLRASEKRDILLYYILENFYTIDEVHKNKLYAFLLKLTEEKAIDFDPFVQPGLYTHFRKQLDQVMLDVKNKGSVLPLLHGIHSSNYNYNMVSRAAIDFETVSFLGKGGFGEVVKARNRIDGAMYALKKVKFRDLPNSEKNLEKVLREVKALAQLDHENVLRYYNAWIEVEQAGDYTKKMLEAVSHKPQLPAIPLTSMTPLTLSPKLSVAVSDQDNHNSNDNNNDSDNDSDSTDGSEDSDETESSNEESENLSSRNGIGHVDRSATSTTEMGEEEEDDDYEESGAGDTHRHSIRRSLSYSAGLDIEFADNFSSLALGENASTSNSNTTSSNISGDSSHNIITLTGSSGSSSHGSRHGINVPMYTSGEIEKPTVHEVKDKKRHIHYPPPLTRSGKPNTGNKLMMHGAHVMHGRRMRKNFETMLNTLRRSHEYTNDDLENKKGNYTRPRERKEKISDESEEEWSNAGTSASKEFSNELSSRSAFSKTQSRHSRNSHHSYRHSHHSHHSHHSYHSRHSRNPPSPGKALAVVPFKPPVGTPPKNKYVLYIQMQLCESKTLKTYMETPGRTVNVAENLAMFSQIVAGLNHIHSRGLIHRDLKPENIFFSPSGSIKIGDFGLSKQFCDITVTNKDIFDSCPSPHTGGVGTRSYASPEQIKGNFYTAKSDIYSLGIILFELFNTFDTHTERAKVLQDLRARIISPSFYGRFSEVARCVLSLMEELPDNRPTADEILKTSLMARSPFSVTSLVVKQQEEIERLQEKILLLQEQLKRVSN